MSTHTPVSETSLHGDGYGHAALLLVESLIHGLIERSILTTNDAIAIMEVALAAQEAIFEDAPAPSASMHSARAALQSLVASLKLDVID